MQVINITVQALAALLGLGLIGFIIVKRKILPESVLSVLTPLVIDIALPCMVFVSIVKKFDPAVNPDWWALPLWWMLFTAGLAVMTVVFGWIASADIRKEFRMSLFYQNGLFVPTGLIMGLFGRDTGLLADLFLFMILYPAFFFNTYHLFFMKRDRNGIAVAWNRVFNPVLAATMAALTVRLCGVQDFIPGFVVQIMAQVGDITIPLIMIILGGSIYIDFRKRGEPRWAEIVKFVAIKNLAFPAVTLMILYLFRPSFNIAILMLIQSAVPPVTSVPSMIERVKGNAGAVNQFLLYSFIASVVTIPAALMVFHLIYPIY